MSPDSQQGPVGIDSKNSAPVQNAPTVQELCESRGGRPGLSVLTSLTASVDVKQHRTMLKHRSQFAPNMSTYIRGHETLLHQPEVVQNHTVTSPGQISPVER